MIQLQHRLVWNRSRYLRGQGKGLPRWDSQLVDLQRGDGTLLKSMPARQLISRFWGLFEVGCVIVTFFTAYNNWNLCLTCWSGSWHSEIWNNLNAEIWLQSIIHKSKDNCQMQTKPMLIAQYECLMVGANWQWLFLMDVYSTENLMERLLIVAMQSQALVHQEPSKTPPLL